MKNQSSKNHILFIFLFFMFCSGCSNKKDISIEIGILQFVQHDALDNCRKGFIEGLADNGYISELNVKFDYQNAQGEQSNCFMIANKFISNRKDLVLAIATPAAQSMANATKKIPILVGAVTDLVSAGLVVNNEQPGGNVTGVSDIPPIEKQLELIRKLLPNSKSLGIFYCSNEVNSEYQADIAMLEAIQLGFEPKIYTVSQSSDVKSVVQQMVNKVDAIYLPTDNLVASTIDTIVSIANMSNIPIICGEKNLISRGAVGTYGIDYYELGKIISSQAIKIIENKAHIGNIPVERVKNINLSLNIDAIDRLHLKIPENLKEVSLDL